MKGLVYRVLLALVWLGALGAVGYFAWRGWSYYATPLIERPRHADYWALKPGGSVGIWYGIVGASMMVVMQVYTLRKRVRLFGRLGRLRAWLDFHILCGVIGPLLIVLHSSLKVKGLVALSFWSMVVVALSGVLGRYLYQQLPRRRSGVELTLAEIDELSAGLSNRLRVEFDLDEAAVERLDRIATQGLPEDVSLLSLLVRLPLEGLVLRLRLRAFRSRFRRLPRRELKRLSKLVLQRAVLARRVRLLRRFQEVFHYWHVVHKPFAVVMYLFMFVHIGVVLMTGYGWIR